jgi:pilus assembly protein CpaB
MGRRMMLLLAALVVAAIGTSSIFFYVRKADERALKDQRPVEVLVAKTLIKAGTTGLEAERQGAFRLQRIPLAATIAGHLRDTRSITSLVAVSDIQPGEQIIPQKFALPGSTSGLPIPVGKMAMSVQLGDPQRVAGFVKPGSEVAVFVTIAVPPKPGDPPGAGAATTRVLFPRIEVIAIGPTTLRPATKGQGNTESLPTAILTLAVDQKQAEKLVVAQSGALYLALLTKDSKVTADTGTTVGTLFG